MDVIKSIPTVKSRMVGSNICYDLVSYARDLCRYYGLKYRIKATTECPLSINVNGKFTQICYSLLNLTPAQIKELIERYC